MTSLLLFVASQVAGPSLESMFLLAPKGPILMEPAVQIVSAPVVWFDASPDGRFVIYERHTDMTKVIVRTMVDGQAPHGAAPEHELAVWDSKSRQSKSLLRSLYGCGPMDVLWTSEPGVAFVQGQFADQNSVRKERSYVVDGASGRMRALPEADEQFSWKASPSMPWVATVLYGDDNKVRVVAWDTSGKQLAALEMPAETATFYETAWTADGRRLLARSRTSNRGGRIPKSRVLVFDPAKATVIETEEQLAAYQAAEPEARVKTELVRLVSGKASRTTNALWLIGGDAQESRYLISGDVQADDGLVPEWSDAGLSATFVSHGGLWRADGHRVPMERYEASLEAAKRNRDLFHAKQVGLAFQLYATDHDDELPRLGDLQEKLRPYLIEPIDPRFVFTLDARRISDIPEPDKAEIGHIVVKGGRVVAFVDGSARFVKD